MPREVIQSDNPEWEPFRLAVGWQQGQEVQVGVQTTSSDAHIIDQLYGRNGDDDQIAAAIGVAARVWLAEGQPALNRQDTDEAERAANVAIGEAVLTWLRLARPGIERDGVWVSLSRYSLNQLIRFSRKARDAAYGRDE